MVDWDGGPSNIVTLKIQLDTGGLFWASKVGDVQKCGKGESLKAMADQVKKVTQ